METTVAATPEIGWPMISGVQLLQPHLLQIAIQRQRDPAARQRLDLFGESRSYGAVDLADLAAALRQEPDYADFYDEITSPRMQHLSRIATNFGANVHLVGPEVIPDDIAASDPGTPFYWTVKLTQTPKA